MFLLTLGISIIIGTFYGGEKLSVEEGYNLIQAGSIITAVAMCLIIIDSIYFIRMQGITTGISVKIRKIMRQMIRKILGK
jgi:hypothetical protein